MKHLILITPPLLIFMLLGFLVYTDNKTEYIDADVVGIVYEKDYEDSYSITNMVWTGKFHITQTNHIPAKYIVKLKYNDMTCSIDDVRAYESLGVGDSRTIVKRDVYYDGEYSYSKLKCK